MPEQARPRAHDIFERVRDDAAHELDRPLSGLAFSALFAGFTIGATPLAVAIAVSLLGSGGTGEFVAALLYPIGYAAVILGRAQFFTENTLYPVILSLQDHSAVPRTARLWILVYSGNIAGALLFALLVMETSALDAGASSAIIDRGADRVLGDFWQNFWGAVIVGWLLALVAWLVEASNAAIGQLAVIWMLTFLAGVGGFDHCIASTIEVFSAVLEGDVASDRFLGWLGTVTLGNAAGGVLIVSLLNYGQIHAEEGEAD